MGYTKRFGTEITDFWPDDTDDTVYYASDNGYTISDLISYARTKWPGCTLDDISISAEWIQTACIYYDRYDAGDYTNFIVIMYKPCEG